RQVEPSRVRATNDRRDLGERRIAQVVFGEKRVEAAQRPVVAEAHALHVERDGPALLRDALNVVGWHEEKIGLAVDEATYQPRAGDAVDLGTLSCDPFHANAPRSGGRRPGRRRRSTAARES